MFQLMKNNTEYRCIFKKSLTKVTQTMYDNEKRTKKQTNKQTKIRLYEPIPVIVTSRFQTR